jgi:Cna protein B-type domain.
VYEEPYTEPYSEVYEEEYTEPEIYTEPAAEPETIEEPEEPEETEELSINAVKGEGHTVSGVVTEDEGPAENVKLLLSAEDDSIEAVSNDKGEFTFTDVANGTYTLKAVDSEAYQAAAEPIEVKVENRNKLGYEIAVYRSKKNRKQKKYLKKQKRRKKRTRSCRLKQQKQISRHPRRQTECRHLN